jgi:hypothetical protein
MPRFHVRRASLLQAAAALLLTWAPLSAQDADRIWGRVYLTSGDVVEGFIRWDRNEANWADILDGSKEIPPENYQIWLDANEAGERPVRMLELKGYRITWDEEDPDFPSSAASGVRFGHLDELIVTGEDEVEVVLRSGVRVGLSGGSTDIGPSIRELIVTERSGRTRELEWEDLDRIDFFAAPPDASAASPRLYGTVQDDRRRSYTGYISWDLDEIFEADTLDGDDEDGDRHRIPFTEIRSIVGHRRGSEVTLKSGRTLELDGSNDVERGNRGIQISDPELGMIEVEWDEFASIRFEEAPAPRGYDAFDGGHPLMGTVLLRGGEELTGHLHWDADEQWSWEFLDGERDDVAFTIEFGKIARVERDELLGARVTLRDGRTFELEDGNDVDWDNKGLLIAPPDAAPGAVPDGRWRYVFWDEVVEVRFDAGPTGLEGGSGS